MIFDKFKILAKRQAMIRLKSYQAQKRMQNYKVTPFYLQNFVDGYEFAFQLIEEAYAKGLLQKTAADE